MYPKLRLLLVECECDGDELVPVVDVARVAGHHNARTTDQHFGPITLGYGVDTKQTLEPVGIEDRQEV